jgi:hypothetical protein
MNNENGPPAGVADRLATLRRLYVPETDHEARARLSRQRPPTQLPFPILVAARLKELRALCELATHLHRTPPPRL